MRAITVGIWDGDDDHYGAQSLACPRTETCTVEVVVFDKEGAPVDLRTATAAVNVWDSYGQSMQVVPADAWEPASREYVRTFALNFSRLDAGPYTWAAQVTIGARTCQVVRVSALTVLP